MHNENNVPLKKVVENDPLASYILNVTTNGNPYEKNLSRIVTHTILLDYNKTD